MPLKLSVGLSRKQGLPNFGSAGATCLLEMELPSDALIKGAEFFEQAEKALEACRIVVEGELARQMQRPVMLTATAKPPSYAAVVTDNRQPSILTTLQGDSGSRSTPYRERPSDRSATARQLQAIERLALRIGANPSQWLHERIGDTPPHCLSLAEASALIDELQQDLPPRMAG